ncbi:dihydrofolate reductase family protein [Deinococcus sp. VB343]|uniref:Dihydrofolate reductase family protein n=1 Tax=Deinococcus sp. VB142 TaxID=3112952 RepID=A0AAU6PYU5_9DEIO
MPFIYATAVTLNGFLADPQHSLDWLFAVPHDQSAAPTPQHTALVMGSHTYEWLLQHEELLAQPHKWQQFFGEKPVFVFSTRPLPTPQGANVQILRGPVAEHLPTITEAAAGGTVWIQGGGDLAGQFLAAGALDEIVLDVAPVALAGGAPVLPREVLWPRLRLVEVGQHGEFARLRWRVEP